MKISQTEKEYIFRIPRGVRIEDLQDLANLFEFKEIAKKSKATQKELDAILNESRKNRWKEISEKLRP